MLRYLLMTTMLTAAVPVHAQAVPETPSADERQPQDNRTRALNDDDDIIVTGNLASFPIGVGKNVTLGILGERDLIDTPMSVKRFDEQFIRNTQSVRVADFAQRDASFSVFGPPANSALDDAFLRGFSITADQYTWNGYYPAETRDFPIEMIETIDILKGPTGLVSVTRPNSASPGGTLNINTKRPLANDLTRLTARFIGDGVFGGHADISRRFGTDDRFGVRANIAYRKGRPIKDNAREESLLAHLAFSYETDRLRIVAEAFYQDYALRGRSAAVLYRAGVPVLERVPDYERLASPSWTYLETERQSGQVRINYEVTNTLEAFGAFTIGGGGLEVKSADVTLTNASGAATATGSFFSRRTPGIAGDGGLRCGTRAAGSPTRRR